jgi:hypothetical protein
MHSESNTFSFRTISSATLALLALLAPIVSNAIADAVFSIDGSVVATGGTLRDVQNCYSLADTIGEPVASHGDSPTGLSLTAGFWSAYPPASDNVFSNSFEICGS